MNKQLSIALCCLMASAAAWAGDDDFGMWGELSVTKRLPYNLSVGLEAELRGKDNMQRLDRWNVGMNVGYKPFKWLKLGAGYAYLQSYKAGQLKNHYKNPVTDENNTAEIIGKPEYWNGYRLTESYIVPKHRFVAMATFTTPKIGKWIRISLRERYQCTWRGEQEVERTTYRYKRVTGGEYDLERAGYTYKLKKGYPQPDKDGPKVVNASNMQSLRSRLKVEMDKKRIDWHPFVAFEAYNDLKDKMKLSDWRLSAGTSWDVTSHHSIGAAYLYNVEREDDGNGHQHVVSISYEYKF